MRAIEQERRSRSDRVKCERQYIFPRPTTGDSGGRLPLVYVNLYVMLFVILYRSYIVRLEKKKCSNATKCFFIVSVSLRFGWNSVRRREARLVLRPRLHHKKWGSPCAPRKWLCVMMVVGI